MILPEPYDDPSTLLAKLAAIANTINKRDSVAAATALYIKTKPDRNPEKAAVAEMTVRESEDWKAYLRGTIQLPTTQKDDNRYFLDDFVPQFYKIRQMPRAGTA